MNKLYIKNFRESAKWFLYANTPSYLYKHLKELGEVENLAVQLTQKELYNICIGALNQKEKNHESELAFYIALIALSFKPYSEFAKYIESLKTYEYKWANHIISFIISDYEPFTIITTNGDSKAKMTSAEEKSENISCSATVQVMHITAQAKVNEKEEQTYDNATSDTVSFGSSGDKK